MAIWALYSAALVMSPARGEDRARSLISADTLVCADQQTIDDVLGTLRDPDVEVSVRRLMLFLMSGGCSDRLAGESYEVVEIERSGIVKARVRGSLTVYLIPLAAIHTRVSAVTKQASRPRWTDV